MTEESHVDLLGIKPPLREVNLRLHLGPPLRAVAEGGNMTPQG